jgi:hypothetical protein
VTLPNRGAASHRIVTVGLGGGVPLINIAQTRSKFVPNCKDTRSGNAGCRGYPPGSAIAVVRPIASEDEGLGLASSPTSRLAKLQVSSPCDLLRTSPLPRAANACIGLLHDGSSK